MTLSSYLHTISTSIFIRFPFLFPYDQDILIWFPYLSHYSIIIFPYYLFRVLGSYGNIYIYIIIMEYCNIDIFCFTLFIMVSHILFNHTISRIISIIFPKMWYFHHMSIIFLTTPPIAISWSSFFAGEVWQAECCGELRRRPDDGLRPHSALDALVDHRRSWTNGVFVYPLVNVYITMENHNF